MQTVSCNALASLYIWNSVQLLISQHVLLLTFEMTIVKSWVFKITLVVQLFEFIHTLLKLCKRNEMICSKKKKTLHKEYQSVQLNCAGTRVVITVCKGCSSELTALEAVCDFILKDY